MLQRVSFSLAPAHDRVPYTHFIHLSGDVVAFSALHEIEEANIGVICDEEFPTDAQIEQMHIMCRQAV
jgi:hypothetical protein